MKVIINNRIGGFSVSQAVYERLGLLYTDYGLLHNWDRYAVGDYNGQRTDPELVAIVEEMGAAASGGYAELCIVEIPDGIAWHICEGETGVEWIAEDHRTWEGPRKDRIEGETDE